MIIKSATRLAFAAVCLTAIATLSAARAARLLAPTRLLWRPTRRLWLWPPTRPLRPSAGCLWPSTGDLCPAEPVCPAVGWNPSDTQWPADQPG